MFFLLGSRYTYIGPASWRVEEKEKRGKEGGGRGGKRRREGDATGDGERASEGGAEQG